MHLQPLRPSSLSWLPAVWVLVGVEVLVVLYVAASGPAGFAPFPQRSLAYSESLLEMAKSSASVNLLVVAGLWLRSRNERSRRARRGLQPFSTSLAAAGLLLAPVAFVILARG